MNLDTMGWSVICKVMQVPENVERCVWRAICRLDSSTVTTLRFALARLSARPTWEMTGAVLASDPLRPQTLVETIELLVQRRYLTRQDAIVMEEAVFASVSPAGAWR